MYQMGGSGGGGGGGGAAAVAALGGTRVSCHPPSSMMTVTTFWRVACWADSRFLHDATADGLESAGPMLVSAVSRPLLFAAWNGLRALHGHGCVGA